MGLRRLRPVWTAGYQRRWLSGDLLAGVTITAYLVPQVMAYADLAGLPAVAGLWSCLGALLLYGLLGTSRQLSVGPESTTALMTGVTLASLPVTTSDPTTVASTLALAVALICLLGWWARFSVLAELLSRPVLVGYMAGIAIVMVISQLDKLTGIQVSADGGPGDLAELWRNRSDLHLPTLVLGLGTLTLMLIGSAVYPRAPVALLGMLGATAVVGMAGAEVLGVALVGEIPAGVPAPGLPAVDPALLPALVAPAIGIAFVGYTDNVLTARAFAARRREKIDPRRELLALGAANLGAGLMHGFPVSSSASRSAIGDAVGGRTQLTGLFTLVTTLIAFVTLRPLLEAFPTAALGAVVVYAAVRLVEVAEFRRFAAFRTTELLLALATTAGVLVAGVLWGILVAIGLSVVDLLWRVVRPHDAIEGFVPDLAGMHDIDDYPDAEPEPGCVVYRYDSPLFFANAEDFGARARAAVESARPPVHWFVLNTEAMVEVDITAVDALEALRRDLEEQGVVLALARVKQDLADDLEPSGLLDRIGRDHVFPTLPTAIDAYRSAHPEAGGPGSPTPST
jgi:SulP family sulfate permease